MIFVLSRVTLAIIVILYLFLLNFVVDFSLSQFSFSYLPALLLFSIFLVISFFHKYLFKFFLSLQIFLASVAIFFKWQDDITVTSDILLSGFINEIALSMEMVSLPLVIWVFITAIVPIVNVELKKVSFKHHSLQAVKYTTLALSLIVVSLFLQGFEHREKGNIRDPKFIKILNSFSPLDVDYNLNQAWLSYKQLKESYSNIKKMSQLYDYMDQEDELTVVFVLGETTRGNHMSLNGYDRNTTPYLEQIDNLYSFSHATSCDTITLRSIPCIVSPMERSHKDRNPQYSAFTEVFKSLGFDVEIYSLQGLAAFYTYLGYDKLISVNTVLNGSNGNAKDVSLLPYVKDAISNDKAKKKLIFVHTLGSHQLYADRVIEEQMVYKPICESQSSALCTQSSLVNAFDNTIIAVDSFLNQIISELQNKKAILIYTSDHGESLGENGMYGHGKPVDIAPKEQFDVPLVFWFSNKYLETEFGQKIQKNIEKVKESEAVLSHDNIFHSILGCSGITSRQGGIENKLDVCSGK